MAYAMGLGENKGTQIPEAIKDMNQRLGLPSGLGEMGVFNSQFPKVIAGAMADHCHKTNPVIASERNYTEILELSM
jgi:alcohol dehydrogenase class IV